MIKQTHMKRIITLLLVVLSVTTQAQYNTPIKFVAPPGEANLFKSWRFYAFPSTDSLRVYNNKWITNNAATAFTNLRLHYLLEGIIDFLDQALEGGGGGGNLAIDSIAKLNDSTLRYRKNGVFRNLTYQGKRWTLQQVLNNGNVLVENASIQLLDSIILATGKTIMDSVRIRNVAVASTVDTSLYKLALFGPSNNIYKAANWTGIVGGSSMIYNVKDFGAVGDGVTDDTRALQRAIDSAAANKGILFIPEGVYGVRSAYRDTATVYRPTGLYLKSNLTLIGSGASRSIIKLLAPPASSTFEVTGSGCVCYETNTHFSDIIHGDTVENIVLKDFGISGNYSEQINYTLNPYSTPTGAWPDSVNTNAIHFTYANNVKMLNLSIDSTAGVGITAYNKLDSMNGNSRNLIIEKCHITTCIVGAIALMNNCDGSIIKDNVITEIHSDGMTIASSNVIIEGNEVSYTKVNPESGKNNFAGIYFQNLPGRPVRGSKILSNYLHNNSSFGIDVWSGADTTGSTYPGASVIIANNVCEYNGNGGIEVAMSNVIIESNSISNNGKTSYGFSDPQFYRPYGININNDGTHSPQLNRVVINGNIITDTSGNQIYAVGNGGALPAIPTLVFNNNIINGHTNVFQTNVVSTANTYIGNVWYRNATPVEINANSFGPLTIRSDRSLSGLNIESDSFPVLRFSRNASSPKGFFGLQGSSGPVFADGQTDDLNIYSGGRNVLLGTGINTGFFSEMNINTGRVDFHSNQYLLDGYKIGIGTSTPTAELTILRNVNGGASVLVANPNNGASAEANYGLTNDVSGSYAAFELFGSGAAAHLANGAFLTTGSLATNGLSFFSLSGSAPMRWYMGGGTTGDEKMRLTSAGDLLIGTATTENVKLLVNGKARIKTVDSTATVQNIAYFDNNRELKIGPATDLGAGIYNGSRTATADYVQNWNHFNFKIDSVKRLDINAKENDAFSPTRKSKLAFSWVPSYINTPIKLSHTLTGTTGLDSLEMGFKIESMSPQIYSTNGSRFSTVYVSSHSTAHFASMGSGDGTKNSGIVAAPNRVDIIAADSARIKIPTAATVDSVIGVSNYNVAQQTRQMKIVPVNGSVLIRDSAAAVAQVDINLSTFSGYERIVIYIEKAEVADNDVELQMRFSNNGGSSFFSGASDYDWLVNWRINNPPGTGVNGDPADDHITLVQNISNSTGHSTAGEVELLHPFDASYEPMYKGEFVSSGAGGAIIRSSQGGRYTGPTLINAVRFFPSGAGQFDKFKYRVVGYKN